MLTNEKLMKIVRHYKIELDSAYSIKYGHIVTSSNVKIRVNVTCGWFEIINGNLGFIYTYDEKGKSFVLMEDDGKYLDFTTSSIPELSKKIEKVRLAKALNKLIDEGDI